MQALLAEAGLMKAPDLYDIENVSLVHHAQQALRAHKVFGRDVDYIVKDGKVIIIDEFTGRMMEGRRYSDGLHQALEAKEQVPIQSENQTLASITFQNYFRLYEKLAGMTGTAATEAAEFAEIYRLSVVEIPTHRADGPQGRGRRGLPHRAREERRDHRGDPGRARQGAAGPGRHGLDREVRAPVGPAQGQGRAAIRCSTPATTSRRRTSSPRPAGSAR